MNLGVVFELLKTNKRNLKFTKCKHVEIKDIYNKNIDINPQCNVIVTNDYFVYRMYTIIIIIIIMGLTSVSASKDVIGDDKINLHVALMENLTDIN